MTLCATLCETLFQDFSDVILSPCSSTVAFSAELHSQWNLYYGSLNVREKGSTPISLLD